MNKSVAALAATVLALAACGSDGEVAGPGTSTSTTAATGATQPPDTSGCTDLEGVKVGSPVDLTGGQSAVGVQVQRGQDLAIEALVAEAILPEGAVELVYADTQTNPDQYAPVVTELIRGQRVSALVGGGISTGVVRTGPIVEDAGIPWMVSPSASPAIAEQGDYWYSVPVPGNLLLGQTIPEIIEILGLEPGATVGEFFHSDSEGNAVFHDQFQALFEEAGMEYVSESGLTTDSDFSSQLTALREQDPDVVVLNPLVSKIAQVAVQARQLGLDAPFVALPSLTDVGYLEQAGGALEGALVPGYWSASSSNPASQDFVEAFEAKYGEAPNTFSAQNYVAMTLIGTAIGQACSGDAEAIQAALIAITGGSTPTIFGDVTFDEEGHALYDGLVTRVVDNDFEVVE